MIVSTPELAVAKAAVTAALLRNDPTALTRGAADAAFELIDSTLDQCSYPNVQVCSIAREPRFFRVFPQRFMELLNSCF